MYLNQLQPEHGHEADLFVLLVVHKVLVADRVTDPLLGESYHNMYRDLGAEFDQSSSKS